MKQLGIKLSDKVIFYHNTGSMWSSRAFWMLKAYGHKQVFVLNGGFKKWVAEGRRVESEDAGADEEEYAYALDPNVSLNFDRICGKLQDRDSKKVDF